MRSISAAKLAEAITAAVKAAPPLPASSEDIPEGTDLDTLQHWIDIAKVEGAAARTEGDRQALAQMGRLAASLIVEKRKATVPEPPDPNDAPDMVRLGAEMPERLVRAIHLVVEER